MKMKSPSGLSDSQQGFTIIEILVAIFLLGILSAVLTATLTGSLSLNGQAQKQLDTATTAQALMEGVRNAWIDNGNYNNACAPGLNVPSGYTVKFTNLDSRAAALNSAGAPVAGAAVAPAYDVNKQTPCATASGANIGTPALPPVMRRVTVQSGRNDAAGQQVVSEQDIKLTLDILRPQ